ncbi:MAG: GDSL family lysophospholipase PlaA [Legionellales bacterium]
MKLLATLGAFIFSGLVYAAPIHNIVIFGDSLSDNGNLYEIMKHQLPPSPPYFQGRFSNGPVWIEHLAASYFSDPAAHLQDYAIGGAGVSEEPGDEELFTLKREVETYLVANQDKASEDSLFVVWIGANNYLGMPPDVEPTLQKVNAGITHSLQRLVEKGAKHILVVNLPDLGKSPAAIEFDSVDTFTYFSNQHNAALDKTLGDLKQSNPDVDWLFFDMHQVFKDTIDHPSDYGFTNITSSCYNSALDDSSKKSVLKLVASVRLQKSFDACDGFLFFDLVHPTESAHKILADKARIILDASGLEFVE